MTFSSRVKLKARRWLLAATPAFLVTVLVAGVLAPTLLSPRPAGGGNPAGGPLAFTGADTGTLLAIGLSLLLSGVVLAAIAIELARRRRESEIHI